MEVGGCSGAGKGDVAVATAARTDELFNTLVGTVALDVAVSAGTGGTRRRVVTCPSRTCRNRTPQLCRSHVRLDMSSGIAVQFLVV